jgi:hypothetical protein
MIEILGYLGMILAIISMLMQDIFKLRVINSIACIIFVVYGCYINSYPVIIMNAIVIIINITKLFRTLYNLK